MSMRRPNEPGDPKSSPPSEKPWESNTFRIWLVVLLGLGAQGCTQEAAQAN